MSEMPRPLNLGEILDRTLQFYRARFLVFFGIAALPAGLLLGMASGTLLIFLWFGTGAQTQVSTMAAGVLAIAFFIGLLVVGLPLAVTAAALGTAALNHAATRAYDGERSTIAACYRAAWKHGWRYLGVYALQSLFTMILPILLLSGLLMMASIGAVLRGASSDALVGIVAIAGGIGFAGYFLLALARLWMAFPACVVEETGAWEAMKRAYRLSEGTCLRILVLWLLGAALGRLLAFGMALPLVIAVELIPGANSPQHADTTGYLITFLFTGCYFAVQALVRPVYAIALLHFYYDQRIRKEGFDIEWMMRQAGMVPEPEPRPEAAPWLPPVTRRTESAQVPSETRASMQNGERA